MELEKVGFPSVDREKVSLVFPRRFGTGVASVVHDISIANHMKLLPPGTAIPDPGGAQKKVASPTLLGIEADTTALGRMIHFFPVV